LLTSIQAFVNLDNANFQAELDAASLQVDSNGTDGDYDWNAQLANSPPSYDNPPPYAAGYSKDTEMEELPYNGESYEGEPFETEPYAGEGMDLMSSQEGSGLPTMQGLSYAVQLPEDVHMDDMMDNQANMKMERKGG
jgi:hypothetical protein